MNISLGLSPANSGLLPSYLEAGADEFFAGYISKEWINTFGWEININRRQWPGASFTSLEELGKITNYIHSKGKKIFLTINEHEYSKKEMDLVLKTIREVNSIPFDALIVSSLSLMTKLRSVGIKTPFHISIGGGCNNIETIKFYRNNIDNITRYILPRKLTIEEITSIAEQSKIEKIKLEVFIMGDQCVWNDEYCFSWHSRDCETLCSHVRECSQMKLVYPSSTWKKDLLNNKTIYKKFKQLADNANKEMEAFQMKQDPNYVATEIFKNTLVGSCGLCAIPILKKIGINTIKIPGRGHFVDIKYIKLAKTILDKSNASPRYCQNLVGIKELCQGQNCYYNFPFK